MHHMMRSAVITDITVTKARVEVFEILKHKSNSATKKITILSTVVGWS